ncbi:guanylate cyclase soluble subunit beta-1-like isoform X2 [Oscarella lobularis]|uniref:guanylate cyclase soluble subunit beta-1-like isoform X2 n=1 Tax=Oscarella lobularis TaxID=121494 RepID=UPI003313F05C
MFGFVNSALQNLIKRRYGEDKWIAVQEAAEIKLEGAGFRIRTIYEDEDTYRLLAAAKEVLDVSNEDLLRQFGDEFLLWCQEYGYNKLLMLLGGTIQEFLVNLDALHDHLANEYPGMRPPSFRCVPVAGSDGDAMILHYYSERAGLHDVVVGIVTAVAKGLYDFDDNCLRIELLKKEFLRKNGMGEAYHAEFMVTVNREEETEDGGSSVSSSVVSASKTPSVVSSFSPPPPLLVSPSQLVGSQTFSEAFPFHLVLDRDMLIVQAGTVMQRVIGWRRNGADDEYSDMSDSYLPHFNDHFHMARPYMENVTFDNIIAHIHTAFVVNGKFRNHDNEKEEEEEEDDDDDGMTLLRLKGQMVYDKDHDVLLYLCSPRVGNFHSLGRCGLSMCDIPIYDATRELILNSGIFAMDHNRMHELEVRTDMLRQKQIELESINKRLDGLLYSILPVTVADRLRNREIVEPQRFDNVTVLYSDIVQFTKIGQQCEPIKVVNMLQELYSIFDNAVRRNNVFKVETIGDAYIVCGGLPEENDSHPVDVVNQALDMVGASALVMHPSTNRRGDIKIRVGVHSGMVYAGVVGTKMPRYCLFGRSVGMAHDAEQTSHPRQVKITKKTYDLLQSSPRAAGMYNYEPCDKKISIPGSYNKEMDCYFVSRSANNKFRMLEPSEPIQWVNKWLGSSSRNASPESSPKLTRKLSQKNAGANRSPLVARSSRIAARAAELAATVADNSSPLLAEEEKKQQQVVPLSKFVRQPSPVLVDGRWYWIVHPPFVSNFVSTEL